MRPVLQLSRFVVPRERFAEGFAAVLCVAFALAKGLSLEPIVQQEVNGGAVGHGSTLGNVLNGAGAWRVFTPVDRPRGLGQAAVSAL